MPASSRPSLAAKEPSGSLRRASAPCVLAVCSVLAAQQQPQQQQPARQPFTLATVLERGDALVRTLPAVWWLPGGHDATVVLTAADGNQTLHRLAAGQLAPEVLVDARTVLRALGAEPPAGPARFPQCRWFDAATLRIEHGRAVHHLRVGEPRAETVLRWDGDEAAVAPGDLRVACIDDHDLWLHERGGRRRRRLTFDGSPDVVYGGAAHRAEFGITTGLFWSPDGQRLAFSREDQRPIAPYPYQDLDALPPAPVAGRYPMAGRSHSRVRIGVCDAATGAFRWLEHDPDEDVYWTNVAFAGNDAVVVARVNRGQDQLELVRYDAATGRRTATLLREHDAEWIEPEHPPTFLADGRFLWWSAQDGHRHLWLHQADGARIGQVTKGVFDVQNLLGLSADESTLWFSASGEDPRQLHLFAARLDGSDTHQVTRERGTHRVELAPDRKAAHVVWSNLDTPPVPRILDLQSGAVAPLPPPPDPLAEFALPSQRLFSVKLADDTVLYGHVALPPELPEGERCPVLLYVYGGPHVQLVVDDWLGGAPLWLQAFAAEGYVVCRLDNRGTPNRGIAFEQSVFRRLGTLEVEDQLRAVAWLKEQPFVDAARIGVHGWSYGGYLTLRLLLQAPDAFACGVSGAPVTDWAMYETGYTERYMDTPPENPDGYAQSSCLPLAGKLQRPLLLVHGTDDRTVMWSHTLAFVDRCVEAGTALEYFPYPMQTHRLVGKDRTHFLRLLHAYLARHLRPGQ